MISAHLIFATITCSPPGDPIQIVPRAFPFPISCCNWDCQGGTAELGWGNNMQGLLRKENSRACRIGLPQCWGKRTNACTRRSALGSLTTRCSRACSAGLEQRFTHRNLRRACQGRFAAGLVQKGLQQGPAKEVAACFAQRGMGQCKRRSCRACLRKTAGGLLKENCRGLPEGKLQGTC